MKDAQFCEKSADNKVLCRVCNHHFLVSDGRRGLCGVRENRAGILYLLVYGKIIVEHIGPIEKNPLIHFQPGFTSYFISMVGCNFRCEHCQKYEISQYPQTGGAAIAGQGGEDTLCPACSTTLIKRIGPHIADNLLVDGRYPSGMETIQGIW